MDCPWWKKNLLVLCPYCFIVISFKLVKDLLWQYRKHGILLNWFCLNHSILTFNLIQRTKLKENYRFLESPFFLLFLQPLKFFSPNTWISANSQLGRIFQTLQSFDWSSRNWLLIFSVSLMLSLLVSNRGRGTPNFPSVRSIILTIHFSRLLSTSRLTTTRSPLKSKGRWCHGSTLSLSRNSLSQSIKLWCRKQIHLHTHSPFNYSHSYKWLWARVI